MYPNSIQKSEEDFKEIHRVLRSFPSRQITTYTYCFDGFSSSLVIFAQISPSIEKQTWVIELWFSGPGKKYISDGVLVGDFTPQQLAQLLLSIPEFAESLNDEHLQSIKKLLPQEDRSRNQEENPGMVQQPSIDGNS